jgi:hypothetical protein
VDDTAKGGDVDPSVLHEFFAQMAQSTPELLRWHEYLTAFWDLTYTN